MCFPPQNGAICYQPPVAEALRFDSTGPGLPDALLVFVGTRASAVEALDRQPPGTSWFVLECSQEKLVRERSLAASLSLCFKMISSVHWLEWPSLSDVFLQLLRVASQGINSSPGTKGAGGSQSRSTAEPLAAPPQPLWRQCLVVVEKHAFALAVHISRRFAVMSTLLSDVCRDPCFVEADLSHLVLEDELAQRTHFIALRGSKVVVIVPARGSGPSAGPESTRRGQRRRTTGAGCCGLCVPRAKVVAMYAVAVQCATMWFDQTKLELRVAFDGVGRQPRTGILRCRKAEISSLSAALGVMGVLDAPEVNPPSNHSRQLGNAQPMAVTRTPVLQSSFSPGGGDPFAFSTLDAPPLPSPPTGALMSASKSHLLVPPLTPGVDSAGSACALPSSSGSRPASPVAQAVPALVGIPWRPIEDCMAVVRASLPDLSTPQDVVAWCQQAEGGRVPTSQLHALDLPVSLSGFISASSSEEGGVAPRPAVTTLASVLVQCLAWYMCNHRAPADLVALCSGHKVCVTGSDDMQAPRGLVVQGAGPPQACLSLCRMFTASATSATNASLVLDTLVALVCDFGVVGPHGDELQGGATALLLQLLHIGAAQPGHHLIASTGQLLACAGTISSCLGAWYLAVRGDGRASSTTGSVLGGGVDGLPPLRGLPGGPGAYTQRDTTRDTTRDVTGRDYTGRDLHLGSGGRATVASAFPSRSGTARLSVVEPSFRSSEFESSPFLSSRTLVHSASMTGPLLLPQGPVASTGGAPGVSMSLGGWQQPPRAPASSAGAIAGAGAGAGASAGGGAVGPSTGRALVAGVSGSLAALHRRESPKAFPHWGTRPGRYVTTASSNTLPSATSRPGWEAGGDSAGGGTSRRSTPVPQLAMGKLGGAAATHRADGRSADDEASSRASRRRRAMLGADLRAALFPGHASPMTRPWGLEPGSHGAYGWHTCRGGSGGSVDGDSHTAWARVVALGTLLGACAALADAANAREAKEGTGGLPLSLTTLDVTSSPSLQRAGANNLLSLEAVAALTATPIPSPLPPGGTQPPSALTAALHPALHVPLSPCPTVPLMLDGRTLVAWRTAQCLRALLALACEPPTVTACLPEHSLSLSRSVSPAPSPYRPSPWPPSSPAPSPPRTLPPIHHTAPPAPAGPCSLSLRVVEVEGGILRVAGTGVPSCGPPCNIPIPLLSNIVWSVVDAQCVGWSSSLASAGFKPAAAQDAITLCLAPLLGLLPALAAMMVHGALASPSSGSPSLSQVCWRLCDACITSLSQLVDESLEDVEDDVVSNVGHAVEVAHVVFLAAAAAVDAVVALCPRTGPHCAPGADDCGPEAVVLSTLCACLESVCEVVCRHGHRCAQGSPSTEVAEAFLQTASGLLVAADHVLGALSSAVHDLVSIVARDVPCLLEAIATVDSLCVLQQLDLRPPAELTTPVETTFVSQLWSAISSSPLLARLLPLQCRADAASAPLPGTMVTCMSGHAAVYGRPFARQGGVVKGGMSVTLLAFQLQHLGCVLRWDQVLSHCMDAEVLSHLRDSLGLLPLLVRELLPGGRLYLPPPVDDVPASEADAASGPGQSHCREGGSGPATHRLSASSSDTGSSAEQQKPTRKSPDRRLSVSLLRRRLSSSKAVSPARRSSHTGTGGPGGANSRDIGSGVHAAALGASDSVTGGGGGVDPQAALSPDEESFDGSDFGSYLSDDESGERSGTLWDPYGYGDVTEARAPVVKLALPAGIIGASSGLVGAGNAADLEGEAKPQLNTSTKPTNTASSASAPIAGVGAGAGAGMGAAVKKGGPGVVVAAHFAASTPSPLSDRPLWDGAVSSPEGSSAERSTAMATQNHGLPEPESTAKRSPDAIGTCTLGTDLHALTLASLLCMVVSPGGGSLLPAFCPIFPLQGSRDRAGPVLACNPTFALQAHLARCRRPPGDPLTSVIPRVLSALKGIGTTEDEGLHSTSTLSLATAAVLLRLMCPDVPQKRVLENVRHIGRGAYGTVVSCTLLRSPSPQGDLAGELQMPVVVPQTAILQPVAAKIVPAPKSAMDRNPLPTLLVEVSALQACVGLAGSLQLLDYFLCPTRGYVLVTELCECTVQEWRAQRGPLHKGDVAMYLRLFRSITAAVAAIHDRSIIHLDIKVDNVLLRSKDLNRSSVQAAFDAVVAIADFGEAVYRPGAAPHDMFTLQSRGTEAVKSPEMRSVAGVSAAYLAARDVDRRRRVGAGAASDVWSLGCLLFELLTEQVLFPSNEEASAESHARVTGSGPILTQDQHQALQGVCGEGPGPGEAIDLLLHSMLQRDPSRRPDLRSLLHAIDNCIAEC